MDERDVPETPVHPNSADGGIPYHLLQKVIDGVTYLLFSRRTGSGGPGTSSEDGSEARRDGGT